MPVVILLTLVLVEVCKDNKDANDDDERGNRESENGRWRCLDVERGEEG